MVVLKKIKSSTLMETLVATVLIIIVFVITSMILNNIFSSSIKSNTKEIDTYLKELEYLYQHNKIDIPYKEELNNWEVSIDAYLEGGKSIVEFEANNRQTNKTITKTRIETSK